MLLTPPWGGGGGTTPLAAASMEAISSGMAGGADGGGGTGVALTGVPPAGGAPRRIPAPLSMPRRAIGSEGRGAAGLCGSAR